MEGKYEKLVNWAEEK